MQAKLPFKGIKDRPYDQKFLEPVEWKKVEPVMFDFGRLYLTQQKLTIPGIFFLQRFSTDPFPRVVVYEGEHYLEDGHHRVVRDAIQNFDAAHMRVLHWAVVVSHLL